MRHLLHVLGSFCASHSVATHRATSFRIERYRTTRRDIAAGRVPSLHIARHGRAYCAAPSCIVVHRGASRVSSPFARLRTTPTCMCGQRMHDIATHRPAPPKDSRHRGLPRVIAACIAGGTVTVLRHGCTSCGIDTHRAASRSIATHRIASRHILPHRGTSRSIAVPRAASQYDAASPASLHIERHRGVLRGIAAHRTDNAACRALSNIARRRCASHGIAERRAASLSTAWHEHLCAPPRDVRTTRGGHGEGHKFDVEKRIK